MDAITILRTAAGCRAAKLWAPAGCSDYDAGYKFDVVSHPVANLAELATVLESLRSRPNMFVVRGQPHQAPARRVLRRSRGDGAFFDETPRYWVMLDVDSVAVPDFVSDPANAAALVRDALPAEFRTAQCYWHASGGAGFKPGARLHLWFWCSRPVRSEEWRAWVRAWPVKVDEAVFRTVQPHYTSDPVLVDVADPMPLRSGVLPGEPEVDCSAYSSENASLRALAEKTLSSAMWRIARAEGGERNNVLYAQACKVAEFAPQLGDLARRKLIESSTLEVSESAPTVDSAFRNVEPHQKQATSWTLGLTAQPNGRWAPTTANLLDVAELHPELDGALATDVRTNTPLWLRPAPWGSPPGSLHDRDGAEFARWLDRKCRFQGAAAHGALSALQTVAHKVQVDAFRDFLDELEWDGTPRLEAWLARAAHAPESLYTSAIGKRWLISAVARTFQPGCKADCVLILSGAQGVGKSTLLRVLAGDDFFSEMQARLGSEDAYMQMLGPVILELPEMAAMRRADVEQIKADISTQVDKRRPKYGRMVESFKRRCVYAATTNDYAMLQDDTGARRFWPVEVPSQIDLEWLRANRDQLWAEATWLYRGGERWHLIAEEVPHAEEAQEERRQGDPLYQELADILSTKQPSIGAIGECDKQGRILRVKWRDLVEPLGCKVTDMGLARRVAAVMHRLGWVVRRNKHTRWYEAPTA